MKELALAFGIICMVALFASLFYGLFKSNDWALCMSCHVFHNCRTGRICWELPKDCDGTVEHRFCPECSKPFLKNVTRQTTPSRESEPIRAHSL